MQRLEFSGAVRHIYMVLGVLGLTLRRLTTYIYVVPHRKTPDLSFYIFSQQICVLNI
jgi:hypothetical protein